MPITEYNKVLNKKEPKFEGNNITKCCQEFLSKMLSKKLSKRFSVSQALADPWIVKSKIKIDEINEKHTLVMKTETPVTDVSVVMKMPASITHLLTQRT